MMPLIIDSATLTRRELADRVGVSVHTVRSWALGRRVPDPPTKQKLAQVLRAHAKAVEHLAEMLEDSVDEEGHATLSGSIAGVPDRDQISYSQPTPGIR